MAWTAPMTFVASSALTAAQLNTHLRDNMFQTEVAKVVTDGQYLTSIAKNQIKVRSIGTQRVGGSETTTSTDYVDLVTIGPAVQLVTSTRALVFISANMFNSGAASATGMSYDVQGELVDGSPGTSLDPVDQTMALMDGVAANSGFSATNTAIMTIDEGKNTFTAKYKVGTGTGSFRDRVMTVFPF
jgi:hypothetical protein